MTHRWGKTVDEAIEMYSVDRHGGFIRNGQVWEAPSHIKALVIYGDSRTIEGQLQTLWVCVSAPSWDAPAMLFMSSSSDGYVTEADLEKRFRENNWRLRTDLYCDTVPGEPRYSKYHEEWGRFCEEQEAKTDEEARQP